MASNCQLGVNSTTLLWSNSIFYGSVQQIYFILKTIWRDACKDKIHYNMLNLVEYLLIFFAIGSRDKLQNNGATNECIKKKPESAYGEQCFNFVTFQKACVKPGFLYFAVFVGFH